MNADYAHLLGGATLDYARLGAVLKAVIATRGCTLAEVQAQTRVSRASVSRATVGIEISTGPLLLLCIWADLNPFELFRPLTCPGAPAQAASKVFHAKQGVKLSDKSRQFGRVAG